MLFDLLIRNGTAVTPSGRQLVDIGITAGRIAAIGNLYQASAGESIDATGLHILPGVIDTQVHFREPGLEHKEDLGTGTKGAILGGVTAIFEMPNTKPAATTIELLQDKLNRAHGRAWCDYAFFIGATAENYEQLPSLERCPGCAGVKIFMGSSTGDLLVENDDPVLQILKHGFRRVSVHCEDEEMLRERRSLIEGGAHPRMHPEWRSPEVALKATTRLVNLAHQAGRRIHVLHVTTAQEIEFLADHKDVATVEVTPHHLTMAAPECYDRLGSYAQMNPPVRDEKHQAALWHGIAQSVVDVLGSDHAPHTREEKDKPYPQSPSGMTGVQTLLPLMLNHCNNGRLSLERLVDLTSAGPARIFNISRKGRIAVGYDADLVLVDLEARRTIANDWIASRAGWTPYDGMEVQGWPLTTILRGVIAVRDGELQGSPLGTQVVFQETL